MFRHMRWQGTSACFTGRKRFFALPVIVERKQERSAPLNKLRSRASRASSRSWNRGAASLKAGVESSQRSPREESVASSLLTGSFGDFDRRRDAAAGEALRGWRQDPRGYILEGRESWRSVGFGLVRGRISGQEWPQERRPGGSGAAQGYGLWWSPAAHRRIRHLSEDPFRADDTVCLLRRLGVLFADIYHSCAGGTLVPRTRVGESHGWGEVGYGNRWVSHISEDEKPYIEYF